MNIKRKTKILSIFTLGIIFLNIFIGAYSNNLPQTIKVTTEKSKLYTIKYENFYINAKNIKSDNENIILYCLEIDKGYPTGQNFKLSGDAEKEISSIIAAGYPSKTPEELNLENESQAYFATQLAIWSYIEDYDVDKMTSENINIVNAIRQIYSEGLSYSHPVRTINKVYISDNNSIQELVAIFYPAQLG